MRKKRVLCHTLFHKKLIPNQLFLIPESEKTDSDLKKTDLSFEKTDADFENFAGGGIQENEYLRFLKI